MEWFGEWEDGKHQIPDTIRVRDYRGKLIVPGFIDTHISIIRKVKWWGPMVNNCWSG